jgi:hypothetical protein
MNKSFVTESADMLCPIKGISTMSANLIPNSSHRGTENTEARSCCPKIFCFSSELCVKQHKI